MVGCRYMMWLFMPVGPPIIEIDWPQTTPVSFSSVQHALPGSQPASSKAVHTQLERFAPPPASFLATATSSVVAAAPHRPQRYCRAITIRSRSRPSSDASICRLPRRLGCSGRSSLRLVDVECLAVATASSCALRVFSRSLNSSGWQSCPRTRPGARLAPREVLCLLS